MKGLIILLLLPILVLATPPACLISCVAEVAHSCANGKIDMSCLCIKEDSVVGCLVDICPYGNFLSARDHYLGTCMEHGKPTKSNPNPPPAIFPPPPSLSTSPATIISTWTSTTPIPSSLITSTISSFITTASTPSAIVPPSQPPTYAPLPPAPTTTPVTSTKTTIIVPPPIITTPTTVTTIVTSNPTFSLPVESFTYTTKFPPSPTSTTQPTETGNDDDDCGDKDNDENNGYDDEGDEDCDNKYDEDFDNDYGDDDDQYDNEVDDCEWEETQTFDENGQIIIIRRPINVPQKYLDPNNNGITRRVIIKKSNGKKYIKPVEPNYNNIANKKNHNSSFRKIRKLKNPKLGSVPETKLMNSDNGFRRQNPIFSTEKIAPNAKNQNFNRNQQLPVYPRYRNRHQKSNNY